MTVSSHFIRLFAAACVLVAVLATGCCLAEKTNSKQPNILLIFPDQWRYDWAGSVWGMSALKTPFFDAVVRNGTVFTRAYVAAPLCAPSRSCLAGGREYDEAGVPSNFGNDYPVNQTTFYKILRGKQTVAGTPLISRTALSEIEWTSLLNESNW